MYFFLFLDFNFIILFDFFTFSDTFEVEYDIIDFALSCNLLLFDGFVTHHTIGFAKCK